jgi:hypothetical protein
MDLRATADLITVAVTADGEIATDELRDDAHDWCTIAYLARVLGGMARSERLANGCMRRIIEIPVLALN